MEGRKRSGMLKKSVYNMRKRLVAFALAAAMVCTNVGADLNAAYAATSSSESVTFEMTGSQLVTAIEEAIENGNVISPGDLDFTNGDIAKFESLFYGEGKVLEVFPDPDGGSMDAELRVFVRLPEDADDMYMVTGDEEIIFLYVNNGEDTISCSTNITRMEDGVEKVKKTKRITVKSFEAAYGDEEINYISKPAEETTAPAPEDVNGPGTEETTAPDTTAPTDEGTVDDTTTVAPGENESTDAPTEEQTTAPEEGSTAPTEGETETSSEAAPTEEATTEEAITAPEATEEKTQEATEAETKETEAPEPEAAVEPEEVSGEPVASIIRHYAPVVADNEEGNAEDAPKAEEAKEPEAEPEEKEEPVKETEAPTEKETEAPTPAETESTTEAQEGNTEESTTAAPDETSGETGESTDPSETTTEGTTIAPSEGDETTAPETTTEAAETPAATEAVQVGTPSEVTKPEVQPEDTVNKASTTDLVGMGYCSTAKVYTTTINQLKALDDFDGYKITYSINPGASARIVDGARGVAEGNDLTFGVINQIGYEIESVVANGVTLTADSLEDGGDGTQIAWYTVSGITEEQDIQVNMNETASHPKFYDFKVIKGVKIEVSADIGVLPENTILDVREVSNTSQLRKAAQNDVDPTMDSAKVVDVIAYDIKLLTPDGNNVYFDGETVNVRFSGARIEENSKDADLIQISYVENNGVSTKEAVENANVNELAVTTVEEKDVSGIVAEDVSFDAQHFTVVEIRMIETREADEHVVKFFSSEDASEPFVVQYVKDGESTTAPIVPDKEGYTFTGWVDGNGNPANFDSITSDGSFYPLYTQLEATIALRVDYVYEDGSRAAQPFIANILKGQNADYQVTSPVLEGFSVESGKESVVFNGIYEDSLTVTVTYYGENRSYKVEHWLQNPNDDGYTLKDTDNMTGHAGTRTEAEAKDYEGFTVQSFNNVTIGNAGDITVRINYNRNYYLLEYNTDGGTYIAPKRLRYGASIPSVDNPTKLGYDFKGWDKNVTIMPGQNTVITAKWEAKKRADYTVVYWQEKVPDKDGKTNGYDFKESVVIKNSYVGNNATYTTKTYEGFKLNKDLSDIPIKITADGKAVKNVYYDRETYYVRFYDARGRNEYKNLRITAKYGQDISDKWNDSDHSKYRWENPDESGWTITSYYTLQFNMPAHDLRAINAGTKSGEKVIIYYVEGLGNSKPLIKQIAEKQSFENLDESDQAEILGFEFENGNWKQKPGDFTGFGQEDYGKWYNGSWLYYTRKSYEINFHNATGISPNPAEVKYEASISDAEPKGIIGRPAGIDSDYIFDGWYTSPNYDKKVEWDKDTMPAYNLEFYAKWRAPEYTISFETNGANDISPITVTKYETIKLPDDPTKEGDEFLGWYIDEVCTMPFIKNQQITSDLTLYAKWKSSEEFSYTVRYVDEAGELISSPIGEDGTPISNPQEPIVVSKDATVVVDAPAIAGYTAKVPSMNVLIDENGKQIDVEYVRHKEWQYTVKYVDETTGNDIISPVPYMTTDNVVMVSYLPLDNYILTSDAQAQVSPENAVATFKYKKDQSTYRVIHRLLDANGETVQDIVDEVKTAKIGTYITEPANDYTSSDPAQNYICISKDVRERSGVVNRNGTLTIIVRYALDSNGPEEKPDTVPDMYEYPVIYNGNEATGGSTVDNGIYPVNADVSVKANGFIKENSTFVIWNTLADGSGTGYAAGSTMKMEKGGLELFAQWKLDTYAVKINHIDEDTGKAIEGQEPDELNNVDYGTTINGETYKRNIEKYA
ncbi:InlB B-repeat-containing protein, partial [Enterocloster bolteae]|uniref:InlB B-repeat-containing protein n=1 Tax=Enterocloster bolteae TaxID=208479 RepID=UPI00210BAE7D